MQPFIDLCAKNPAFAISAMIFGGGIVLFVQAMFIIAIQCHRNYENSGKFFSAIFAGMRGEIIKPEPERFITAIRAKENEGADYFVKTNRGKFPITVSHDPSKVMINPWCLQITRGNSRSAIVYYREGLNDYAAIEEAVKKILR